MKKPAEFVLLIVAAAFSVNAAAQQVWTYELVRSSNDASVSFSAPRDLTYPPPRELAPVVAAVAPQHGISLTAREEAKRVSAPQLVITLVPLGQAHDMQSAGRF